MRKTGLASILLMTVLAGAIVGCGGSGSSQPAQSAAQSGNAGESTEQAGSLAAQTEKEEAADDGTIYEITLGTVWAPEHYFAKGMDEMAKELEEKSGGRFIVKNYHNCTLGSEKDLTDGVSMGTVTLSCLGPGQVGNLYAPLLVFDAPYLIQNNDHMQAISRSEVCRGIWEDAAKTIGVRPLGSLYLGSRFITTSKKPVIVPDDLKGLKIRVPDQPISIAEFKAFGANPTPMAYSEVYLALQQNVVDGQENPLVQISTAKFFEVQKYLSNTGHVVQMINPCINEDFYQSLPEDLRVLLTETVEEYCVKLSQESVSQEEALLQELLAQGMELCEADKDAFREKAKAVIQEFEQQWGEGIYEELQNVAY